MGPTTLGQSKLGRNGNEEVTLHSPMFQDCSLSARWFDIISRTLIGGRNAVGVFYSLSYPFRRTVVVAFNP